MTDIANFGVLGNHVLDGRNCFLIMKREPSGSWCYSYRGEKLHFSSKTEATCYALKLLIQEKENENRNVRGEAESSI